MNTEPGAGPPPVSFQAIFFSIKPRLPKGGMPKAQVALLCPCGSPKTICVMKNSEKSLQEFASQVINVSQQSQVKGGDDIIIEDAVNT